MLPAFFAPLPAKAPLVAPLELAGTGKMRYGSVLWRCWHGERQVGYLVSACPATFLRAKRFEVFAKRLGDIRPCGVTVGRALDGLGIPG